MSVPLYADVHVDGRVLRTLANRGIDIVRAQDDGAGRLPDPEVLDRATSLQRVVVTYDDDFLAEAVRRQREGTHFAGLLFVTPAGMSVGERADQLQITAECMTIGEFADQIVFLPL